MLGSPLQSPLEVQFSIEAPADRLPGLSGGKLTLASPWLSGMPVEGAWDRAYLDELTYWVTYAVASRLAHLADDDAPDQFQMAILDEYAILSGRKDVDQAPILRRVVARHGVGVLPEVLYSMQHVRSTPEFVARWLAPFPSDRDIAYPKLLLDITMEAAYAGRMDTFALGSLLLGNGLR
jgi:hypothetical protein